MIGRREKILVQQRSPAQPLRCLNLETRLNFVPVEQNTYWHHVLSLDDAEEGVGNLVHMLHAQRVECGIALVFWFGREGRLGNGALKHAPIWLR